MTMLALSAVAFLILHLVVSGSPIRGVIVGRIGEAAFLGLFSLLSAGGIVLLAATYGMARSDPANTVYWGITGATRHIQFVLQALALLLIVPGILTPNPTSVRQEGALNREDVVKGMLRITRHPFLWGVALLSAGHLIVNGDTASLMLFGTLLVIALCGTMSIDAKRRRALGDAWTPFAEATSNIPFAAILSGRQPLRLGEIGLVKIGAAVAVYLALVFAHPFLFGVAVTG